MPVAEMQSNPPVESGVPFRVMIVDDNIPLAETLSWIADEAGYETLIAHDGRDALDKAPAFKPDVIVMDLGMPHMDGLQACRALRADPKFNDVKIMAHSAWGTAEWKEKTAKAGFDIHLVKPIDVSVFLQFLDLFRVSKDACKLS